MSVKRSSDGLASWSYSEESPGTVRNGKRRVRACWYTHRLGFLVTRDAESVGGAEKLYYGLAPRVGKHTNLVLGGARRGPGVELIQEQGFEVVLHPYYRGREPWNVVRAMISVWRAMRLARADVIVQGTSSVAAIVARCYGAATRTPFVYHWHSDGDAVGRMLPWWARPLFKWARRSATFQVVQTREQMKMLTEKERRSAVLIPNTWNDSLRWRPAKGDTIVWVANLRHRAKRPDRLLELARRLPHRRFRIVGGWRETREEEQRFVRQIEQLGNVVWSGPLPHEELPGVLADARCIVNTSDIEGFPLTFLEAAAASLPVVSWASDPGGLITSSSAGVVCQQSMDQMVAAVESMFDDATWNRHRAGCQLVAEEFGPARVAGLWIDFLQGFGGEHD